MSIVRWGVLSTANIGVTQGIPAIRRAGNAELVGLASRGDKGRAIASSLSIPVYYESYEELLDDPQIEAVYIPLPNHLHKEWALKAAERGKHILCEKPAFLNAEDAKEVAEACNKNGVLFMEAFMYQFHPQHRRVKEILSSGEIGEVKYMRAAFSFFLEKRENDIRMKREMGGGSLYDVGCYCIHSIRHILESEPSEVSVFANLDPDTGVDLSSIVHMKLQNGLDVVFDCSFDMDFRHEYEIIGTKGKVKVPGAYRPDVHGEEATIIIQSPEGERTEKIAGDQYKLQFELFSQAVLENTQPPYTLEDTNKNMRVIDACYESIKTGSTKFL